MVKALIAAVTDKLFPTMKTSTRFKCPASTAHVDTVRYLLQISLDEENKSAGEYTALFLSMCSQQSDVLLVPLIEARASTEVSEYPG